MESHSDTETTTVSSEFVDSDTSNTSQQGIENDGSVTKKQKNQLLKRKKCQRLLQNNQMRYNPMSAMDTINRHDMANLPQNFGSINIQNSSNPLFGQQINYHGPVTIQQFFGERDLANARAARANEYSKPRATKRFDDKTCETDIKLLTDGTAEFRMVRRHQWLAQSQATNVNRIISPATRVIIGHTATDEFFTLEQCSYIVRLIQARHIEARGWSNIGYNFLVGGDGSVYEGRGWEIQGAHTKGYNEQTICIAFIGTFNESPAPDRQLNVAQQLLQHGVDEGKLIPNYKLYGHCQLAPFPSPGEKLYEKIQTWPNWTDVL